MPRSLMPSPYAPTLDLATMLPALRATLEEQRRFRHDQLAGLARSPDFGQRRHRRPVGAGDDPLGTVAAALAVGAAVALYDVETALARMGTGKYGTCLRCSGQMPLAWLAVIPESRLCAACRERAPEHRERVPRQ